MGAATKPWQIRAEAKANAQKIAVLADAFHKAQRIPLNIHYKDENLTISFDEASRADVIDAAPIAIEERAFARIGLQEQKRQESRTKGYGWLVKVVAFEFAPGFREEFMTRGC